MNEKIHLEVLVQMPDGTFQYRPLAIKRFVAEGGSLREIPEIPQFDTRKEALDWVEIIYPEKVKLGYTAPDNKESKS